MPRASPLVRPCPTKSRAGRSQRQRAQAAARRNALRRRSQQRQRRGKKKKKKERKRWPRRLASFAPYLAAPHCVQRRRQDSAAGVHGGVRVERGLRGSCHRQRGRGGEQGTRKAKQRKVRGERRSVEGCRGKVSLKPPPPLLPRKRTHRRRSLEDEPHAVARAGAVGAKEEEGGGGRQRRSEGKKGRMVRTGRITCRGQRRNLPRHRLFSAAPAARGLLLLQAHVL